MFNNISLLKLGLDEDAAESPLTIYISPDYDLNESQWELISKDIITAIHCSGVPAQI
jgi:hypothetical protein